MKKLTGTLTVQNYDPCNITFMSDNKKIGSLDWKDKDEITFTGNADESAKKFFEALNYIFKGAIDKARSEAK